MPIKTEVILVAGGLGRRMGDPTPKAFLTLGGRPMISYALQTFTGMPEISGCIVVVPSGEEHKAKAVCQTLACADKVKEVVCGGARRQDSVRCGMDYLSKDAEIVLIHDAARPFCSPGLVNRIIAAAEKTGAAIPGLPLVDTLKRIDANSQVAGTVDRRSLVAVQTPQGFRQALLREAYQHAWNSNLTATDDAGLVEQLSHPIAVVEGENRNFKITRPFDLELAEILLAKKKK
jgi:2-C-methyl-D-erythritol 4-phosphate cytidylyltransferase